MRLCEHLNVKIKGRWEASVRPDEARNIINPCCNIVDVHDIFYETSNMSHKLCIRKGAAICDEPGGPPHLVFDLGVVAEVDLDNVVLGGAGGQQAGRARHPNKQARPVSHLASKRGGGSYCRMQGETVQDRT